MNGKQLKNSILQWAIQGKLVPQNPNDEPASVLLERIREEKARLVKEKKIKKDKNESIIFRGDDNSHYEKFADGTVKCIDDEIPFEIPAGWAWCKIKHICTMQAGKNISASKIFAEYSDSHPYRCVGGNGLRGYTDSYNTSGHYSIVGRQGALCGCLNIENGDFYATEHAVVVDAYDIVPTTFIYYFLTALNLNQYATATAQPGLAVSNIIEVMFPLPPIQEQQRIVEQIELIMPLVNKYEQSRSKLDSLNKTIYTQLKKSILQEAIQGKLVPQDPNDEPASVMLERIKEEKAKLFKEGKLKKKDLVDSVIFKGEDNKYYETIDGVTGCIDEEIPYDLPSNWAWTRLGNVAKMTIGKTPARGDQRYWSNGEYSWVSISDMKDLGVISATKERISAIAVNELMGNISPKGSLLMSFKLTVGRTSLLEIDAYHNEAIVTVLPLIDECNTFRNYLFRTLPLLSVAGDSKDAIKGKTLNSQSLSRLLIPLPPMSEQERIVQELQRVTSLMN